ARAMVAAAARSGVNRWMCALASKRLTGFGIAAIVFRGVEADEKKIFGLVGAVMDEHWCFTLREIVNSRLGDDLIVLANGESNSLRLFVDLALHAKNLVGLGVVERARDDAFFVDGQLQDACRLRVGAISADGKRAKRQPFGTVGSFVADGGGDRGEIGGGH